jgi:hypothetical protein
MKGGAGTTNNDSSAGGKTTDYLYCGRRKTGIKISRLPTRTKNIHTQPHIG